MDDYQRGYQDGYREGQIITQPVNTNGHTEEEFVRIRAKYYAAIYSFAPTQYELGYGDGLDAAAYEYQESKQDTTEGA